MGNLREIKVVFIFKPHPALHDYLVENLCNYNNIKLIFPDDISEESLLKYCSDADIIVGWRPSKLLLQEARKLLLYINPGAGVQHLIPLFKELGNKHTITLVNGHGNSYFTAQHTVSLFLALLNKVIPHHNWMSEGKWRMGDMEAKSIPLRDKVIGFLGYGHVNSKVHQFMSGFQVKFSALRNDWTKQDSKPPTELSKYSPGQFHQFLKDIDVLIISIPQTSESVGSIKLRELELLGSEGWLVNVGRGLVINENDLYYALQNKIIKGAAIDVWYEYSPQPDSEGKKFPYHFPFHNLDNVVLSPHRAASPLDDLQRWNEVIENIIKLSRGESKFLNVVDLQQEY